MSSIYVKSLVDDFSGNLDIPQFRGEVIGNIDIFSANCITVASVGANVDIIFDGVLSNNEQNVLNILANNHIPNIIPKRVNHFKIYPDKRDITSDKWMVAATFNFPGSDFVGTIDYIDIVSCMDENLTFYNVEVVNMNNNKIIASATFTNTALACIDMGSISNIPKDPTIMRLSIKSNNNKNKVILQEIQIWHSEL